MKHRKPLLAAALLAVTASAGPAADTRTVEAAGFARYDSKVDSPSFGRAGEHILPDNGLCGFAPAPPGVPPNMEFRTVFVFSLDRARGADALPPLKKLRRAVLRIEIKPLAGFEPRLVLELMPPTLPDADGNIVWNKINGFGDAEGDPLLPHAEIAPVELDVTELLTRLVREGDDLSGLVFRLRCEGGEFDGFPEIASHDRGEILAACYWTASRPALELEFD